MTTTETRPTIDPRIWNRRVAVTRANGRKRLRVVIGILALCALAAAGVGVVHSPLFGAKNLEVVGAVHTPESQILSSAGLSTHPPLVDINASLDARQVETLPWVKSATVTIAWPDSATVTITERSPVAAVGPLKRGSSRGTWALVDRTGRVLAYQDLRPLSLLTLTVPAAPGQPGSALSGLDEPGIDIAGTLPSQLVRRVVSVGVGPDGQVSLGLTGNLTAVIGTPVYLPAKYEALLSVLAAAQLQSGDVINVTVPQEPTVGSPSSSR